jgi:aspartyl-tRNA(Asn)/glutamyl-tRNA(Gln) amidotransferase subunit A
LRLAAPQAVVLDELDATVSRSYATALSALSKAGAGITDIPLHEIEEIAALNGRGGFAASEAYAWHKQLIEAKGALYDPRVLMRIMRGKDMDAAEYIELNRGRADLIRRVAAITSHYDALVMPTVPIIAPPLAELDAEERYRKVNLQVLRNPTVANMLDRCAISLPCHRHGEAPVGLMLIGEHGGDRRLFAIAAGIEAIVSPVVGRA